MRNAVYSRKETPKEPCEKSESRPNAEDLEVLLSGPKGDESNKGRKPISTIPKTQISKSSTLLEEVATLSRENDEVRLEGGLGVVFVHIQVEAYILTLVICRLAGKLRSRCARRPRHTMAQLRPIGAVFGRRS
jgi:translation initiation factor 2 beta subunit (eIF-2beta)/eIF-5